MIHMLLLALHPGAIARRGPLLLRLASRGRVALAGSLGP